MTAQEIRGSVTDLTQKLEGRNGKQWLAAFKRFLRKENPWSVAKTGYPTRFAAAIAAGNLNWVNDYITPKNFPENVFGEVGEGHVLAQPPQSEECYWIEDEINSWLKEKVKEGYEAATLADGLDYVAKHPQAYLDGTIVFWASVSSGGRVAYVSRRGGERSLLALRRGGLWGGDYRFLLRKVR